MSTESAAIAVKSATGVYTAAGAVGTFVVALLGLVGVWVKFGPRWKEIALTADEKLRDDLLARVDKLESQQASDRQSYQERLEGEREVHQNEVRILRHRMNNLDQCLTMLLMLIEQDPVKAKEAAARVRAMREEQQKAEAAEKGAIRGAREAAKQPNP